MAYNNNTPLATDTISATQAPIHDNFADIATLLNVNHVGFNVANQGKHKFVTMPAQASTPVPLVNEVNLFSRTSTYTTNTEMCVARNTGEVIEITSSLQNATGWAFTSSGILFKWGNATANNTGVATTITFPVAATIPVYGTIFNVFITTEYLTGLDENTIVTLTGSTNVNFTVLGTNRTNTGLPAAPVPFLYMAIGIL